MNAPRLPATAEAALRPASFTASNRLAGRIGRPLRGFLSAHFYLVVALVLHLGLALLLTHVQGLGEAERERTTVSDSRQVARRMEQTQTRELQWRVRRLEQIHDELRADPISPASSGPQPTEPSALVARARSVFASISDWEFRTRSETLAKLTDQTLAQARHQIAAEDAAAAAPVKASETPAETITRLHQLAEATLAGRRAQLEAQQNGILASLRPSADHKAWPRQAASAPAAAASGAGQAEAAGGIPRSARQQLAAMIRLGGPQGRVGTDGVANGNSVNPENVKGMAEGRVARAGDADPIGRTAGRPGHGPAKLPPPNSNGDTADAEQISSSTGTKSAKSATDKPAVVGFAGGAATDVLQRATHQMAQGINLNGVVSAAGATAGGRVFGAGGTYAGHVYLDNWYVIGPFQGEGDASMAIVYPPEEFVDLDGVYPGWQGHVATWKYVSRGFYPFIPPDLAENAVYYAYTELRVDEELDLSFAIASDDDSKMWVDDRIIWISTPGDKPWYHPPYYQRDELIASLGLVEGRRRVHLDPGVHRLLFKLYNARDQAFFSVVVSR